MEAVDSAADVANDQGLPAEPEQEEPEEPKEDDDGTREEKNFVGEGDDFPAPDADARKGEEESPQQQGRRRPRYPIEDFDEDDAEEFVARLRERRVPKKQSLPTRELDPRSKDMLEAIEKKRMTLLSKYVTKEGVDINMVLTQDGETAAHTIVRFCGERGDTHGYEPLLRLALRLGADPNVRTSDGSTPAHRAAEYDLASSLALLKSYGGSVDEADDHGYAPAHVCATYGKSGALDWLLADDGGVPVERQHTNGMSLAMMAARAGHLETLKCLKKHGANLRKPCLIEHDLIRAVRVSASVMAMACYEGRDAVIEWLEAECDIGAWESSIAVTDVPISDEPVPPDDVDAYAFHGWDVDNLGDDGSIEPFDPQGPFPFGPMTANDMNIAIDDLPKSQFSDYKDYYNPADDNDVPSSKKTPLSAQGFGGASSEQQQQQPPQQESRGIWYSAAAAEHGDPKLDPVPEEDDDDDGHPETKTTEPPRLPERTDNFSEEDEMTTPRSTDEVPRNDDYYNVGGGGQNITLPPLVDADYFATPAAEVTDDDSIDDTLDDGDFDDALSRQPDDDTTIDSDHPSSDVGGGVAEDSILSSSEEAAARSASR